MAASQEPLTAEQFLGQLVEVSQDQLRWQRAAVLPQVRETIERVLTTTQMRKAYELCEGSLTGTEIAKKVGASQPTFSRWASAWSDLGIAYEIADRKVRHLTSLKSLGLPLEVDG